MLFEVEAMDTKRSLFRVRSNTGECMDVNEYQILDVLLKGYKFTNVHLTSRGFAVKFGSKTKYVQIGNMTKEMSVMIHTRIAEDKAQEEIQKQIQQREIEERERARKQALMAEMQQINNQQAVSKKEETRGKRVKISDDNIKNNTIRINFRGTPYLSAEALCREYKRDVKEFLKLYNAGYSVTEALGLVALKPKGEKSSRELTESRLNSMARTRGEAY